MCSFQVCLLSNTNLLTVVNFRECPIGLITTVSIWVELSQPGQIRRTWSAHGLSALRCALALCSQVPGMTPLCKEECGVASLGWEMLGRGERWNS